MRGKHNKQNPGIQKSLAGYLHSLMVILAVAAMLAVLPWFFHGEIPAWQVVTPPPVVQETAPPWFAHVDPSVQPEIHLTWEYMPNSLDAVPQGINVLSPTWFTVEEDEQGRAVVHTPLEMGRSKWDVAAYIAAAHNGGAKVWATVTSFDSDLSKQVVTDPVVQADLIVKLQMYIKDYGLDGLCLDFEKMDPADKPLYTAFVAAVRAALPQDKTLVVTVTVHSYSDEPGNWWQCYDREALAEVCDYLAVMTYDEHKGVSDILPVAGLDWVEGRLQRVLEEVPSGKLLLGIPFYGVDHMEISDEVVGDTLKNRAITPTQLKKLLETDEFSVGDTTCKVQQWEDQGTWHEAWGIMMYVFLDMENVRHTIMVEDAESLAAKAALAKEFHVAGVAVWQKSQGIAPMWQALSDALTTTSLPE